MKVTGFINGEFVESDTTGRVIGEHGGVVLVDAADGIREVYVRGQEASDGNSIGSIPVEAESERQRVIRERFSAAAEGSEGGQAPGMHTKLVKAPMPGMVKAVSVQVGAIVKRTTPVIILEAMKMENSITAGSDGTVTKLHVAEGTSIEKNALICEIEPNVEWKE